MGRSNFNHSLLSVTTITSTTSQSLTSPSFPCAGTVERLGHMDDLSPEHCQLGLRGDGFLLLNKLFEGLKSAATLDCEMRPTTKSSTTYGDGTILLLSDAFVIGLHVG